MVVKPTHYSNLSLSLPKLTPSTIQSFKPWIDCKISMNKHYEGLAQLWRFHILLMLKPYLQSSNKNHSPHVIKRHHGVSINLIAADNKHTIHADNQLITKSGFEEGPRHAIFDRNLVRKHLIMLTSPGLHLPHAKFSGHFVALVPLIVFCIVCIVGAFPTRVAKDKEFEESDEPMRLQRWKNVLSDNGELDILHSESRLDYNSASEDRVENLSEDTADAYSKIEDDYRKFLSECGISG